MKNYYKPILLALGVLISVFAFAQDTYKANTVDNRGKLVSSEQTIKEKLKGLNQQERVNYLQKKYYLLQHNNQNNSETVQELNSKVQKIARKIPAELNTLNEKQLPEEWANWVVQHYDEYIAVVELMINHTGEVTYSKQPAKRKE